MVLFTEDLSKKTADFDKEYAKKHVMADLNSAVTLGC
jgi:hypothetical protein